MEDYQPGELDAIDDDVMTDYNGNGEDDDRNCDDDDIDMKKCGGVHLPI